MPLRSCFAAVGTLPYHRAQLYLRTIRSFGASLEPRYIFGAACLDQ
jgi:hypothetical protein